jgi:hypothetical protein
MVLCQLISSPSMNFQDVKVLPPVKVVPPGSHPNGGGGNETDGAWETKGGFKAACESTGRSERERRRAPKDTR